MTGSTQGTNGWSEPRPERGRFSSRRKAKAVLRLLHGEELDALSRELGVTAATLAQWRERFLAGGQASLKSWPAGLSRLRVITQDGGVGAQLAGRIEGDQLHSTPGFLNR